VLANCVDASCVKQCDWNCVAHPVSTLNTSAMMASVLALPAPLRQDFIRGPPLEELSG
jgi:hypothetical protein